GLRRLVLRALRAVPGRSAHAPRGAGLAPQLHPLRGHRRAAQRHLCLRAAGGAAPVMTAAAMPPSPGGATPSRLALYLDLIRWNRPAGWLLLLWPSLSALWVAADGFPGWHLLAVFVAGTILMRSAGCCVNDVADREFDRHVKRTVGRPVTSGRIGVREALSVGGVLALVAFVLVLTTNLATIAWSVVGLLLSLVYPYAKRHVSMPQAVLGVAFSFGIPMAFSAVQG